MYNVTHTQKRKKQPEAGHKAISCLQKWLVARSTCMFLKLANENLFDAHSYRVQVDGGDEGCNGLEFGG